LKHRGTNYVVGQPICLDAGSPDGSGTKGTPSPLWLLVAAKFAG
jgi:hypothetical protein